MTNMTKANEIQVLLDAVRQDFGDKLVFAEPVPVQRRLIGSAMLAARARDAIAAALSALANHRGGGVLLLGVRSGLRTDVIGVDDLDTVNEGFQAIVDGMVPQLAPECRAYTLDGRVVFAADVQPVASARGCFDGARGPEGGRFKVEGRRIVAWRPAERIERGPVSMPPPLLAPGEDDDDDAGDRTPVPGASLRDLDGDALRRVFATANVRDDEVHAGDDATTARLRALGLVTGHGLRVTPTRAGVLAFARRPDRWLRGACIVVVDGGGAIVKTLVGEGHDLALIAGERVHAGTGLPKAIIEELVLNAWAHRDWNGDAGSVPIQLVTGRSRVEVISPGARGEGTRNPTLVDLLRRRGVLGARGQGLARVASLVRGRGGFDVYDAGEECHAVVELGARPVREVRQSAASAPASPGVPERPTMSATTRAAAQGGDEAAAESPGRTVVAAPVGTPAVPEDEVVAVLRARGESTTRGLTEQLGWSRSKARDVLARLVGAGRVVASAADPRSPHQSYRAA